MLSLKGVKVFLLVLSILMIAVSYSHAVNVPQMINYSGTLNDINGNPVANGNYSMEFRIYDQASGGALLWTEKWDTTTSQVPVVNGTFNVMLGAIDKANNPIPASFFAQYPTTYLGIKVGNDSEMLPRQMITSVGYALSAWNGVPKGGIIMWSGAVADIPAGWALCDGSNGTPNLRDRFIVGAGSGYGVGSAGEVSSINLSHAHTLNATDTNHSHWVNGHILTVNEMPNHTHIQDPHSHGMYSTRTDGPNGPRRGSDTVQLQNNETATATNQNTGGGAAHDHAWTGTVNQNASYSHSENSQLSSAQDIRPPYYALAFIMKL